MSSADPIPERAVLTLAAGKRLYLDMAFNLARSFGLWHRDSDIGFTLVTDVEAPTPPDLGFVRRIQKSPQEIARGFSSKLHLDRLAPARKTLFIDSDCLCVRNLDEIFRVFEGRAVSVVGTMKKEGEWFGDIGARCGRYGVKAVPVFVGAVYYLEPGEACNRVFETARRVEREYDEAGFVRLRGVPNEEPLISVGMAMEGCEAVPDDGKIKVDAMYWKQVRMDLCRGQAEVDMPDPRVLHPTLLHFNCSFAERPPYTNEVFALRLSQCHGWPSTAARWVANLTVLYPFVLRQTLLNLFRPLYHAMFGARKIRPSPRIPTS